MHILKEAFGKKKAVEWEVIDNEAIILLPKRNIFYRTNPMGTHVWKLIDGKRRVMDIVGDVADKFDVEYGEAKDDIIRFARELLRLGLIG